MATRKAQRSSGALAHFKGKPSKKTKFSEALGRIRGLESEMTEVLREMQEKVRQLECLNEFSSAMNSALDPAWVGAKALEATCKLLGCKTAALFLVDKKKSELFHDLERMPIDDQTVTGYTAMTGESQLCNELAEHPHHLKKHLQPSLKNVHTLVSIPLRVRDQVIGVLLAMDKLPSAPKKKSQHSWPDFYENDKKLLETLGFQVAIALENSRLYTEIKKNFFETVEALAEAIEKKDRYTGGHTKRVVYYAMCIAKYLQLSQEQIENIRLAAILHDVGKIGIEDKILKKQSQLDPEEWKVMQTHPELGFEILGRVEGLKEVIAGTRYHHERWDGKGYPLGLKGEEIPLVARIVSVADTYDAMASTRPYRKGMDPKLAYEEILKHRGTQFDPMVVDAFSRAFQNEKMGKGSGGSQFGASTDTGGQLSNCD